MLGQAEHWHTRSITVVGRLVGDVEGHPTLGLLDVNHLDILEIRGACACANGEG